MTALFIMLAAILVAVIARRIVHAVRYQGRGAGDLVYTLRRMQDTEEPTVMSLYDGPNMNARVGRLIVAGAVLGIAVAGALLMVMGCL